MDFFIYIQYKGQPIKATVQLIDASTKEVLSVVNDDNADITVNEAPENFALIVSAPGYNKTTYSLADFAPGGINTPNYIDLSYQKKSKVIFAAIALALAVYARSKKKRVGALTPGELETFALIAAAIFGFSFIKQFLEAIGLWKSADTKALDNASTDPNSFWSPNFFLSLLSQGVQWSAGSITRDTANQWLSELQDAFSFFGDNESVAIGILKRCRTQATLSFLAWCFNQNTGADFLSYLRGKSSWYPWAGLSDADINSVSTYISKLPKY